MEAQKAASLDEVPVGAVIVKNNGLISSAYNQREMDQRPTAHAEILAIERASLALQSWRILGCTLYVTLEPCVMCAGALVQSRIERVVFGASDPKGGALGTLYEIHQDKRLNHNFAVTSGVCRDEASHLLSSFFKAKRTAPSA